MIHSVALDRHRLLHVNGKAVFPILARHMPVGGTPRLLADTGFHAFRVTVFGNEGGQPEPVPEPMDEIAFWAYLYDRGDFTRAGTHETELRRTVSALRKHPSLLAYENYNEPTLLYKSGTFKTEPERLEHGTRVIRELDPGHPVWLAHCCGNTVETLRRFNGCCDIVGANPYPIYVPGMRRHIGVRSDGRMLDCPDQSVHAVGRYTDKMMAVGRGEKPIWMLIQALANEHWFNPHHTPQYSGQTVESSKVLYPTYDELRFMAFDAIVSGATGLGFSMNRTPTDGEIWQAVRAVVRELRALNAALAAEPIDAVAEIRYTDLGFTIWDGVKTLARRHEGSIFIFAVNTAFDPAEVRIRLSVPTGKAAIIEPQGHDTPIESGELCDRFEAYGVRVYRLTVV